MKNSLRGKLILVFTLIFIVSFVAVMYISIHQASNFLQSEAKQGLMAALEGNAAIIQSKIEQQLMFIDTLANRRIIDDDTSWEEKVAAMEKEAKKWGYEAISIADLNGNFTRFDDMGTSGNILDRDYFVKAKSGEANISDILISRATGEAVMTVAAPIVRNGEITGVLYGIRSQEDINSIIGEFSYGESGTAYIINKDGQIMANRDLQMVLEEVNILEEAIKDPVQMGFKELLENEIMVGNTGVGEFIYEGNEKIAAYTPINGSDWSVIVSIDRGEVFNNIINLRRLLIGIGCIAVMIAAICIYIASSYIIKPITALTEIIARLSNYDLSTDENDKVDNYGNRKDEIGEMAKSLILMKSNLVDLIINIYNTSHQLASSSGALSVIIQQTTLASDETAKTIEEIAKGATSQAEDTSEGSNYINDLGGLIDKNQKNIKQLNLLADTVRQLKDEGFGTLSQLIEKTRENDKASIEVNEAMMATNGNVEKIEKASLMIKDIADQTNLLALNAAIEAARAGESGKGFAVVAEEIRKLAEESNSFANDINNIIQELSIKTERAVSTMASLDKIFTEQNKGVEITNKKFEGIAEAIDKVKEMIEELDTSSFSMEKKKEEIVDIILSLTAISQENAASAEEASASVEEQAAAMVEIANGSEELAEIAKDMQKSIKKFKY